jgi:hypothetical protein
MSVLVVLLGATLAGAEDGQTPRLERRWFYAQTNLQVEANADRLIELIRTASDAGYNGVVLADYKLNILDRVPDHYFRNAERVREAAATAKVEIIPAVFPIGYSAGLLAHDPNLAEGLPATSMFEVRGGEGRLVADEATRIANGGLEEVRDGDRFAGFGHQDDPGHATVADREVKHGGRVSCRMRDTNTTSSGGNSRLIQSVKVRPHACYRLSAWVKTEGLASPGGFRLLAIGSGDDGRSLTFTEGGIEPTMDWTRVSVVFNSLDYAEVNLYAGLWGGSPGTLWLDDLAIEEVPLTNVLRRPGCPLVVRSADGSRAYEEGRDFEPIADPKLGQDPFAGEYEFRHEGPSVRLKANSRIEEGERLAISWYHPVLVHGEQVACCLTEPKVDELLRDQARRVEDLFHPRTYFMSHDELRVANWCRACRDRKLTAGQLLADNVRRCTGILREINPDAEVFVWSDMFDPNHNAVERYYLVNGTLEGSWDGLGRSVGVCNWNSGKAARSLRFFADRGHRQVIAGYYDTGSLDDLRRWEQAAEGVPGVVGFMYTTWQQRFDEIVAYGRAMSGRPGD